MPNFDLTPPSPDDNPRDYLTSARIKGWMDCFQWLLSGNNIQRTGDVTPIQSGDSVSLVIASKSKSGVHWEDLQPESGSAEVIETPFFVRVRAKTDDDGNVIPGEFQAQVIFDSVLLLTLLPSDNIAIDGIAEWFDIDIDDFVMLHLTFDDDGDVDGAEILSSEDGDWDTTVTPLPSGNESYVEYTGDEPNLVQAGVRLMIAIISNGGDDDNPEAVSEQILTSYLGMRDLSVNGYQARYPFAGACPDLGNLNSPRPDDVP